MGKSFYVIGGEYADTSFSTIADGKTEERHGPFNAKEAYDFWRSVTGKTVDNAMIRYDVRDESEGQGEQFYVVGGEYADTSFTEIAGGKPAQRHGPFNRKDALDHWRALTGKTVDSCLTRFHIEAG